VIQFLVDVARLGLCKMTVVRKAILMYLLMDFSIGFADICSLTVSKLTAFYTLVNAVVLIPQAMIDLMNSWMAILCVRSGSGETKSHYCDQSGYCEMTIHLLLSPSRFCSTSRLAGTNRVRFYRRGSTGDVHSLAN